MPEYVYALHDFTPEHEDEVSFHAGERIEVIEKDEQYSDGWWQGRNLAGQVGLFPQSYTTSAPPEPAPPSASTSSIVTEVPLSETNALPALRALQEEQQKSEPPIAASGSIVAPVPQSHAPAIFLNDQQDTEHESENGPETSASITSHHRTTSNGEEVMKATMTDVQQAIEQLGRSNAAGDEARSFSFASSRGDVTEGETDTEYDMSDVDAGPNTAGGETWHKGARTKLAERAKRAVEEAEKLEALMNGSSSRAAPPIDVELSDESEGEEDFTTHSGMFSREHPHISEEEEEDDGKVADLERSHGLEGQASKDSSSVKTGTTAQETNTSGLERLNYESKTATTTQTSFPVFHPPSSPSPQPELQTQQSESVDSKRSSDDDQERYRESLVMLPSSKSSTPAQHSQQGSVASTASAPPLASELAQPPRTTSSIQTTFPEGHVHASHTAVKGAEREKKHPTEWDVGEVVEWLKARGFDQDVCEKFTEQEITGDVLIELDVSLLKTELGIMAFGKRMRIANAISDLRRPPSFIYPESAGGVEPASALIQRSPSLIVPHSPMSVALSQSAAGQGQGHSRGQSQAYSTYSTRSFPGSGSIGVMGVGQTYSYGPAQGSSMVYDNGNKSHIESPEAMDHVPAGERIQGQGQVQGQVTSAGMNMSVSAPAMTAESENINGRPANLMLSPSEGVLKTTVIAVSDVREEEDRGAASEGETHPTGSMRRRLFGRSSDSNSSKPDSSSRHSRDGSVKGSLSIGISNAPENGKGKGKEKEKEKKSKRSGDSTTGKSTVERLSIFGSTFGGTLGKGRKPPPKYPNVIDEASSEHSPLSFFGLASSSRKVSDAVSHRDKEKEHASMSSGTVMSKTSTSKPSGLKGLGKEHRDPALLRKRTASAPAPPVTIPVGSLKQGLNILEQIGEADHKGWMRKKGDRYNAWKLRYFVLKGPDLYCLRSNSPMETKIKGYVNILGYKVTVDENVNPGRYGFRIEHDHDKTHYFSSDEKSTIRDWMKAIMKATIGRDYTKPVISSCNIPTIPLMVAQAMNPAPRPPSPSARAAMQKALRRENTNQLSPRDARVLMGLSSTEEGAGSDERARLSSSFTNEDVVPPSSSPQQRSSAPVPARPSREMRRVSAHSPVDVSAEDSALVDWANSHLSLSLQIKDPTGSICSGIHLLRIAESIKGKPISPPVLNSAFPQSPTDDRLEGLFQLFDFLLDNEVKMGSVSINDVRQGKRDKIIQLLRALKAWEDKRKALVTSIGPASPVSSTGFTVPVAWN